MRNSFSFNNIHLDYAAIFFAYTKPLAVWNYSLVALNGWKWLSCWADWGWQSSLCTSWHSISSQPSLGCLSLGWWTVQGGEGHWGRDAGGWRYLVLWVWQQGGLPGSHGSWLDPDSGGQVHQQGSGCSCDWKAGAGTASCEGTSPALPSSEEGSPPWLRAALGGTKQETQVCQALGVIFFPQDSTKEGNEKRSLLWLRFTLEGCCLPAAPMLQHRKFASANTWCCFKQPDGPNLSLR